jgi:Synergist-CTERM protein sorting domain-containing protein
VVQVGGNQTVVGAPTGTAFADAFTPGWIEQVRTVAGSGLVEGVEGPWEPVALPAELDAFWAQFALLVRQAGFLPIIGALPPGLPLGSPGATTDTFCATVAAVRTAVGSGLTSFAWSHHARSLMGVSPTDAALDFRTIRADCALEGVKVFLTQAGPLTRAWAATDSIWMSFLNTQLAADGDLVGAALFQVGDATTFGLFNLTAIATTFAAHLQNPLPFDGGFPDGGVPDGGVDAGASSGVLPAGHGAPGGELVPAPSGGGCSTAGSALLVLALLPLLVLRRPRRRKGSGRAASRPTG